MFADRTQWRLAPNRLSQALEQARKSGAEILDLTISNPTRAGLCYDEPKILDSLSNDRSLDYDPQPKGLLAAREAVAAYYRSRQEKIDPESLILTTGTSEAYSYVFRLLANPEDEILVPKPSYPLFDFLADLQDVRLVPFPLIYDHGWIIDFHSFEKVITPKTRGIVLVNPNNPTGSYVSRNERAQLNKLCGEREIALIVDEVFLDYSLTNSPVESFATNCNALTFTLSGLSKISALPQMKLAWIAVNGPVEMASQAMQRLEVIADTYLSVGAPVQWAAAELLHQRKVIQPQLLRRVGANLAELDRQLTKQKACTRLSVEGGWYALLRVPVVQSDEELAVGLLRDQRVLVHPGHFYDFPQDGFLVMSLITSEDQFRCGVERTLEFVATQRTEG